MIRLMVPMPILIAVIIVSFVYTLLNMAAYHTVSFINADVVWSGSCTPGKISVGLNRVIIEMSCNGESFTENDADVIAAWINDRARPQCDQHHETMLGDFWWTCQKS